MNANIDLNQKLNINDFSHFFVQSKQIKQICKEYSESNENKLITVLLTGSTSCGKTSLMNVLLKDFKFDIFQLLPTSYSNISQLKQNLRQFVTFRSILSFDKNIKKVIYIEDLDNLEKLDRYFFSFYQDLIKNKQETINFNANCLIITSTNSKLYKKLNIILPLFNYKIVLPKLSFKQCFCIVNTWLVKHDIDELVDYDKLTVLIHKNNCELRVIFNHIEDTYKNNKIQIDSKKDSLQDAQPSDLVKLILKEDLSLHQLNSIMANDTNQTLALIHENYPQVFKEKRFDVTEMRKVRDSSQAFLDAEIINKICFDNSDGNLWSIYEYFLLKKVNTIFTNNIDKDNNKVLDKLAYSQLINKQSLAFNFNKKINKSECHLTVYRKDLTWIFYYMITLCFNLNHDTLKKYLSRNEIEVLSRFASDHADTTFKSKIQKLKTGLD